MTSDKDKIVKNEIRRLVKLYKDLDEAKRLVAKNLIEEAAFMLLSRTTL